MKHKPRVLVRCGARRRRAMLFDPQMDLISRAVTSLLESLVTRRTQRGALFRCPHLVWAALYARDWLSRFARQSRRLGVACQSRGQDPQSFAAIRRRAAHECNRRANCGNIPQ